MGRTQDIKKGEGRTGLLLSTKMHCILEDKSNDFLSLSTLGVPKRESPDLQAPSPTSTFPLGSPSPLSLQCEIGARCDTLLSVFWSLSESRLCVSDAQVDMLISPP